MNKLQIILASASIGRKQLLEKLGVPFEVMVSNIDEENITDPDPYKMLELRARAKAQDVVKKLSAISHQTSDIRQKSAKNSAVSEDCLIIAADSMAVLDGQTYGKAKNKADAKRIISELMGPPALASGKSRWRAGKTHEFVTATSIIYLSYPVIPATRLHLPDAKAFGGQEAGIHKQIKQWNNITKTKVTLRLLSPSELTHYVARYDFTRFAAGYALNETPWDLVTKIEGSYTNVIGLPFEVLLPILRLYKII